MYTTVVSLAVFSLCKCDIVSLPNAALAKVILQLQQKCEADSEANHSPSSWAYTMYAQIDGRFRKNEFVANQELSRFVGRLEGVSRTQSPNWWAESFLHVVQSQGRYKITELRQKVLLGKYTTQQSTLAVENNRKIVHTHSDKTYDITAILDRIMKNDSGIVEVGQRGRFVAIAVYGNTPYPYNLYIYDTRSMTIRSATIWSLNIEGWNVGVHSHRVSIQMTPECIAVYGGSAKGLYLETFAFDGAPILKYSTNTWTNKPLR